MDPADILPRLERLDDEIDDLEEALQPLMKNISVDDIVSKLPLLDKAKFYVLVTYSIESMLFSSLRLNGVDAKEHPVFKELTRVRQYFAKIKNIENPPQRPDTSLNKEAAIRFIRSDLADNKEINTKLTEMIAKERAKAALKDRGLGEKRKAGEEVDSSEDSSSSSSEGPLGESSVAEPTPAPKKRKMTKQEKREANKKKKARK